MPRVLEVLCQELRIKTKYVLFYHIIFIPSPPLALGKKLITFFYYRKDWSFLEPHMNIII